MIIAIMSIILGNFLAFFGSLIAGVSSLCLFVFVLILILRVFVPFLQNRGVIVARAFVIANVVTAPYLDRAREEVNKYMGKRFGVKVGMFHAMSIIAALLTSCYLAGDTLVMIGIYLKRV